MSRRKRRKKEKSRNKLAYGIIAVAFILILLAYHLSFPQSNQTSQPKAAIVDQLGFKEETRNQTFTLTCKNILEAAEFSVDCYDSEEVTVDFYKNLLNGYGLIVLRAHSALIGTTESLGLFTSEHYDPDNIPPAYYEDIAGHRLVEAYFTEEEREQGERYFAISPEFIEKYGNFQNTTITMMGCDGLKYNETAGAFIKKGAKVCVGWNGLVGTPHTDRATTRLLEHLVGGNTVNEAVEETMKEVGPEKMYVQDQGYNSELKYYPENAGSYTIQCILGISGMETLRTNTVLAKEGKKGTRINWL